MRRKNLPMVFIDLEKAYDKIPRDLIWLILDKSSVSRNYFEMIKDMNEAVVNSAIFFPAGPKPG